MAIKRIAWKITTLSVAVAIALVVYSLTGQGSPRLGQVRDEVNAPDYWVPFTAIVNKLEPGKTTNTIGRLYRGADGSRRIESGPDGRPVVISINNLPLSTTFAFSEEYGWYAVPMQIPDHVRRPPKFRVDNVKTFRHEERIEGFELLRMVHGSGQIALVAPALNGESLVRQNPDGSREVLSEIMLGDQPADLFEPPAGTVFKPAPAQPNIHKR